MVFALFILVIMNTDSRYAILVFLIRVGAFGRSMECVRRQLQFPTTSVP